MFLPADQMPADSRIWVYQSSREFSNEEETKILSYAKDFISIWTAHNHELKASFEILHHIFLILLLDEKYTAAGGCSIDKSIHFIQKVEREFNVSLLDRFVFAIKQNEKIRLVKKNEFESLVNKKEITEDTIVFNNLVQTKKELDEQWAIPLKESWHKSLIG